jgi:hypothetical protein
MSTRVARPEYDDERELTAYLFWNYKNLLSSAELRVEPAQGMR